MLKTRLLHPEILSALASAGHGSTVLLADGNYPFGTTAGPNAQIVYLNLAPGHPTVPSVLAVLADSIPIEAAQVMVPDDGPEPPIFAEFRRRLPERVELSPLPRFAFYEAVRSDNCALVIATGEQRIYANILLTIGVVPPPDEPGREGGER